MFNKQVSIGLDYRLLGYFHSKEGQQFVYVCQSIQESSDVSVVVKQYIHANVDRLHTLFLSYTVRNRCPSMSIYMGRFDLLMLAVKSTQLYLEQTDLSKFKRFKRSNLLLDFCRTVIPTVSHPMIKVFYQDDSDKRGLLDHMYDAFTILVMMNTIIDDSADVLGDSTLIDRLGRIHRCEHYDDLVSDLQPEVYRDLVRGAWEMWEFALDTLQDYCHISNIRSNRWFAEYVYPELDRIMMCMRYSIVRSEMPLGDFEQALFHYEIGMILHLFWAIECCVMHENGWVDDVSVFVEPGHPMADLCRALSFSNSVCACIANDFATLDRELDVECHTNSAVHLCQDMIVCDHLKIDLKELIYTYSRCEKSDEQERLKQDILELFKRLGVQERLFDYFQNHLSIIHTISEDFYAMDHPYANIMARGTLLLVSGNMDLLSMYLIMRSIKGAV